MAVASLPRQPFAELDNSRLQSLSSTKNRQNALTEILASGGKGKSTSLDSKILLTSPIKRPLPPAYSDDENENEDAENVDPGNSPSIKRTKNLDGVPVSAKKHNVFSLDIKATKSVTSFAPLGPSPTSPTPQKSNSSPFAFHSFAPSSPIGRLPKPKRVGALMKKRHSTSPYKRIDPPSFSASKNKPASLPFSLDAAISGTLSKPTPSNPKSTKATTLRESMPTGWFFDIHEDTPDEEAAILMEHSTCTLDISSDDEAGPSRKKDDRGKENIPPPDLSASDPAQSSTLELDTSKPRRPLNADAMIDVGEDRSPLGALPTEDFYAQGLDKDSVQVVTDGTPEVSEASSIEQDSVVQANDENSPPAPEQASTQVPIPSGTIDLDRPDFVIAEDPVDEVPA